MVLLIVGLAVFTVLAVVVLRLLDRAEETSTPLLVVVWLTYVMHADTVILAAFSGVGRVALPATPSLLVGGLAGMCGLAVFLSAASALARDADLVRGESRALVTGGVYAWIRHPQDVGWALLLLAVAIAGRSVAGLVLVVVFVVFARRLWRVEEERLAARFGERYEAYRLAVPAVPGARRLGDRRSEPAPAARRRW